jgi:hypothetical protein
VASRPTSRSASARTTEATALRHRAHTATCGSAAVRAAGSSVPSPKAPIVSSSRHSGVGGSDGTGAALACRSHSTGSGSGAVRDILRREELAIGGPHETA